MNVTQNLDVITVSQRALLQLLPNPGKWVEGSIDLQLDWIASTGSAQDLVSQGELPDDFGYYSSNPMRMLTANGESSSIKTRRSICSSFGQNDRSIPRQKHSCRFIRGDEMQR